MIIYKIGEINRYGEIGEDLYFSKINDALIKLKNIISIQKKEKNYAKCEEVNNGKLIKLSDSDRKFNFKENILYEVKIAKWYKTSYEYDEWDIDCNIYYIKKILIN